jgi:hypothetical protein
MKNWIKKIALGIPTFGLSGVMRFLEKTGHYFDLLHENDRIFQICQMAIPQLWIRTERRSERDKIVEILKPYKLSVHFHEDERGSGHQNLHDMLRKANKDAVVGVLDDDQDRNLRAFFDVDYPGAKRVKSWLQESHIEFRGDQSCKIKGLSDIAAAIRYSAQRAKNSNAKMFGWAKYNLFFAYSDEHKENGDPLPKSIDRNGHIGQAIFFLKGCPANFDAAARVFGQNPQQYYIDTTNVQVARESGIGCIVINDFVFAASAVKDGINQCNSQERGRRLIDLTSLSNVVRDPNVPLLNVRRSLKMLVEGKFNG